MFVLRKVKRIGGSVGIIIPADFAEALEMDADDFVVVGVENNRLFVSLEQKAEQKVGQKTVQKTVQKKTVSKKKVRASR